LNSPRIIINIIIRGCFCRPSVTSKVLPKDQKYKGPFSMDYRERGSHARDVLPYKKIFSMRTTRIERRGRTRQKETSWEEGNTEGSK